MRSFLKTIVFYFSDRSKSLVHRSFFSDQHQLLTKTMPLVLSMIYEQEPVKKRIVMVLGRQHPGESPSSFVVQGKVKTTCNNPPGRHFKVKQAAISEILFCLSCSISTLHMPQIKNMKQILKKYIYM